jgi:hypothetical protein
MSAAAATLAAMRVTKSLRAPHGAVGQQGAYRQPP